MGWRQRGGEAVLNGKRVAVVLPAYNAQKTLRQTVVEIDRTIVDDILLVDDGSTDETVTEADHLGLLVIRHETNLGYGANQKTCYEAALKRGADIVIMLHPDYQYTPRLLSAMASMIAYGTYDAVMASRILGKSPLKEGMPLYKYVFNRILTLIENLMFGLKLSEYHSGYRGFTRSVLESIPFRFNSDDFVFDNQMIAQILISGFQLAEISCPTRYDPQSSSISFRRSVMYGLGVLRTAMEFRMARWNLYVPSYLNLTIHESLSPSPVPTNVTHMKSH